MENQLLYKFRSLQNLRRFLDILVHKRLHMAHYNEMNDPMEGAFIGAPEHRDQFHDVWEGKRKQLICCLSKNYKHTLLWSHYADGHQGCCLEVEVTSRLKPIDVEYSNKLPPFDSNIEEILAHKSDYWNYEQEVRFLKSEKNSSGHNTRPWLTVKIKRVFLGYKMDKTDVSFYKSLIHSILGEAVEVRQIRRDELNTGFW